MYFTNKHDELNMKWVIFICKVAKEVERFSKNLPEGVWLHLDVKDEDRGKLGVAEVLNIGVSFSSVTRRDESCVNLATFSFPGEVDTYHGKEAVSVLLTRVLSKKYLMETRDETLKDMEKESALLQADYKKIEF